MTALQLQRPREGVTAAALARPCSHQPAMTRTDASLQCNDASLRCNEASVTPYRCNDSLNACPAGPTLAIAGESHGPWAMGHGH